MRTIALLALLVLTPLTGAVTQEPPLQSGNRLQSALVGPRPATVTLQGAPRRDPVLAGALSFFVPFGTGSFYAGNVTHGAIHAAIAVATGGLLVAHLCLESCTDAQETWMTVGFFSFVANWAAGTVVAVLDARAFNRRHRALAPRASVEPGTRVRVTAPDCGLNEDATTLVASRSDSLVVAGLPTQSGDPGQPIVCPLASVTRFEVSRGQWLSVWRGALYGGVLGATGGGIFGGSKQGNVNREQEILKGAAIFGGAGVAAGMILGTIAKGERWGDVPLDRLRVTVVPQRDGRVGFGLSVAF